MFVLIIKEMQSKHKKILFSYQATSLKINIGERVRKEGVVSYTS